MIHKSPFPDVEIPDIPLTEFVLQHAERLAGEPALIDGPSGRALTYAELYWGNALRDVPDISDEHNLQDDGIHFRFRRVFE